MPIFILMVFSFNQSKSRANFTGFTLKWYKILFEDTEILIAFRNTILIALVSSVVATVLGTLASLGIQNASKVLRKITYGITNLPMINPEIVTGVSLMLLFVFLSSDMGLTLLKPGLLTLILSHITFCIPYVFLSVTPKLKQMDPNLYEAALDLGCKPARAFFQVVLPEIKPGVFSGMLMSFTLSIDDFVISYFTSGTVKTLPIAIYAMTRKNISPEVNALSTILFLTVFILLVLSNVQPVNIKQRSKNQNEKI